MKVAVVGRGNVGGGLADLWERAGHEVVRRLGRGGGDVSEAEAVLVAVPGSSSRLLLERRIREVEDERSDGEVVQHQLRSALRSDP
jgi:homoserine dehydrogenase